jgi:HlyD family secretion protein
MRNRLKKYVIPAALAATGAAWWAYRSANRPPEIRTAAVERGDVVSTISATGTTNAVVTVQVGSQVSGNIKALYADFNTKVAKGQLVALIDPEAFLARVQQARANVDAARAQVANAEAQLRKAQADIAMAKANSQNQLAAVARAKVGTADAKNKYDRRAQLFKEDIIGKEELDTYQAAYESALAEERAAQATYEASLESVAAAEAQYKVAQTVLASAQAQVKQAQGSLQQAEVDLAHTEIKAPVDGTVVARRMDVGQTVAASFQAPTIFEIAQDLAKMQVDTSVDEADIGRVQVGQPVTFTVDAYPGVVFPSRVKEIRRAPINTQNVITYDVVVSAENPNLKLFPGMTANVRIKTDEQKDVLKVPNAALRYRPPEESAVVHAAGRQRGSGRMQTLYVSDGRGNWKPVRVQVGISDGSYTVVSSPELREGMQVAVGAAAAPRGAAAGGGQAPMRSRGPAF